MCGEENTSQAASVEFVRRRRTNYARSRLQPLCQKVTLFDSLTLRFAFGKEVLAVGRGQNAADDDDERADDRRRREHTRVAEEHRREEDRPGGIGDVERHGLRRADRGDRAVVAQVGQRGKERRDRDHGR